MKSRLEDLIDIGFGVDVGDTNDMFERFVNFINTECGGIRGRQLDLGQSEWSPLEGDAAVLAACVEATEDRNTVVAMNSSGMQGPGVLCMTEENETNLITTQGLSEEFLERSAGRLVTVDASFSVMLGNMITFAEDNGLLDGRTIGVVGSDQQGQPEAVENGLVNELEARGFPVVVYQTVQCDGGTVCSIGVPEAVSAMADAGVDLVLPTLNILSLPVFVQEMVTQGFTPDAVDFITSNFNSQAGDLVASKVKATPALKLRRCTTKQSGSVSYTHLTLPTICSV